MKKKFLSVLLILVLLVSFGLVTAVPVEAAVAPPLDREAAILAAADRLVATQNDDGGFDWHLDDPEDPATGSGENTLGITAIGILKAYELEAKPEYRTALAKAYGYAKVNTARYVYPDVTYLVWLADAAEADPSLLAAIVTEEPGTTIQGIRTLAESIWTTRMAGGSYGTDGLNLDAAGRAVEDLKYRDTLGYAGLGFWDLEAAVKAALALGLDADAQAIAGVMYANLAPGSPYYFAIADTNTICYVLALSGSIEAFSELEMYPTMARTMTDQLIAFQDVTGYWDEVAVPIWGESVQSTAYAVMALVAQGDTDALAAAQSGSDWLVGRQNLDGGWNPIETDYYVENLEVNSEVAWALTTAEAPVTIDTDGYYSIQSAIDAANPEDTISVAAGTYDLTAPIVVDESVTLTGDVSTPGNVVVNAPTTAGLYDRDCFQVIANDVTIQGFRIVGAMDDREGDHPAWAQAGRQNAGIMVGSEATLTTLEPNVYRGISGGTFSYNEFVDCSKGLFLYHATNCEVSYNDITTTEGQNPDNFYDTMGWNGDGVHVYLEVASDYPTGNIISHNTMDNVRVGVFLNGDSIGGTDPTAWDFRGTTIEDNTMTDVWNAGIILQCASGTAESPITINLNNINTSTGRRGGDEGNERGLISAHGDYTVITDNTLTNSQEHGLWVDGSHHTVTGNIVTSNTLDGIHAGWYKEVEPVNGWTLPEITRADITIQTNNLANVGLDAAAISGKSIDSIAILGNTVSDFVKGGIVVQDVLSVQIEGNIISNTSVAAASNGIQVGYIIDPTATTGMVKDNQVSGCLWEEYDPETETYEDDWTSSGILVIAPNSALEISGNEVQSCDVALDIETGPDTFMTNNDVHDNSYGFVLWNADPAINFNNIYQNALGGAYRTTDGSLEGNLDATNNWWNYASGPYHATNPDGQGDAVSDNVTFSPWFGAGVEDSESEETVPGDGIVVDAKDETDTEVVKSGTGTPTVTVTEYTDNPGGGTPGGFTSTGKYIDVHLDTTDNVTEIEIRNYYTQDDIGTLDDASLRLSWWNGIDWIACSDSGATLLEGDPTYRGYVWAKIGVDTTPDLDDLIGTAFMSMGKPPVPPPAVGGGGGGGIRWPPEGTTNVRGEVSSEGVFEEQVTAFSEDELCTLTIPEDTVGLTEDLEPLDEITILREDEPPEPPEDANIVGLAYDFGPDGATFDPPITLEYTYDPDDIPEGKDVLVVAYYDEVAEAWVSLEGEVDTVTETITVSISHFTTFAIIASAPPPPAPPAPAPAPPPVVVAPAPPAPPAPPPAPPAPVGATPPTPEVIPPFNWALLGGIIGVVVATILLIFILMRKESTLTK